MADSAVGFEPSSAMYDTVSFLSDLGLTDEFVGVVRAVIADLAPHVRIVDITHGIAPFDVRAGSLALARAIPYVPAGIVIAAIDPGVGGDRPPVAVEVAGGAGVIIGPDNGLIAPAVALTGGAERAVALTNVDYHLGSGASTMAARDIYAPVAAHLCNGVSLTDLGDPVDPAGLMPGVIPLPRIEQVDGRRALACEVLWVDRFGNCQINAGPDDLTEAFGAVERVRVVMGDTMRSVALVEHFDALAVGAVGILTDGSGMLALVAARASAARDLAIGVGDQVMLSVADDDGGTAVGVDTPVQLGLRR